MIHIASSIIIKLIVAFILSIMTILTGDQYVQWEKKYTAPTKTTIINNRPAIYIIHHPEKLKSSKL